MKFKALGAALVLAASGAQAQWSQASKTDDGGYYVWTASKRFNNSTLTIYTYPQHDCEPILANVFSLEKVMAQGVIPQTVRLRVDKNPVHWIDGLYEQAPNPAGGTRVLVIVDLNGRLAREFVRGRKLILDDDSDAADGMKTDEFSLRGSEGALEAVIGECRSRSEWGPSDDDEWAD